jgi:hypothetical protein
MMHFYQSHCIHITNLEFIGCGGNQVRHAEEFVVEDTKFEGQENSPTALELIETTAQIVSMQHFCIQQKRIVQRMC